MLQPKSTTWSRPTSRVSPCAIVLVAMMPTLPRLLIGRAGQHCVHVVTYGGEPVVVLGIGARLVGFGFPRAPLCPYRCGQRCAYDGVGGQSKALADLFGLGEL